MHNRCYLRALAEGIQQVTPEMSRYVIAIATSAAIQELMKKQEIAKDLGPETPARIEIVKQHLH